MKPFQPDLLPLNENQIGWSELIPLIGRANAELARFDGILLGITNPFLLLSPLTTREAVLSSKIEGTQANFIEVLELKADPSRKIEPSKRADIQEISNYRSSIFYAINELKKRPLCLRIIRELHNILLNSVRGANKSPGNFRTVQNYIGPPGCSMENATFVPPSPNLVIDAMDNWEKYLHFDEKDRIVQLAVVNAQFEIIHPFLDGNGRIGRMLVPLFLYEKKMLTYPMFYLSSYIERNREAYYHALCNISKNHDWKQWIKFFLNAIIVQAQENNRKASAIHKLYNEMKKLVPSIVHSQYVIKAVDSLFNDPIFTSNTFINDSGIPKHSALRIINALKKNNIIESLRLKKGREAAIHIFMKLVEIIEN